MVYFGKGKGSGPRHPTGKDGKTMRCHMCGPEHNLQAKCPHRGKGGGNGTFTWDVSSSGFVGVVTQSQRIQQVMSSGVVVGAGPHQPGLGSLGFFHTQVHRISQRVVVAPLGGSGGLRADDCEYYPF